MLPIYFIYFHRGLSLRILLLVRMFALVNTLFFVEHIIEETCDSNLRFRFSYANFVRFAKRGTLWWSLRRLCRLLLYKSAAFLVFRSVLSLTLKKKEKEVCVCCNTFVDIRCNAFSFLYLSIPPINPPNLIRIQTHAHTKKNPRNHKHRNLSSHARPKHPSATNPPPPNTTTTTTPNPHSMTLARLGLATTLADEIRCPLPCVEHCTVQSGGAAVRATATGRGASAAGRRGSDCRQEDGAGVSILWPDAVILITNGGVIHLCAVGLAAALKCALKI